jgi:hypothetical protein
MLEMRLRLTDIATLSQSAPSDRLLMCTLDARTRRVPRPELLGRLFTAGRLQCLVLLTGQ